MITGKHTPLYLESERVYQDLTNDKSKLISGSRSAEKFLGYKKNSGVNFMETERINANNQL